MPGEIITPPANVVDLDAERAKARAEALATDATRRSGIQAAFARHLPISGVQALLDTCLADHACTPEAAGLKLLDHIGAQGAPINGALTLTPGEDEADKRVSAQVDALLARMGQQGGQQGCAAPAHHVHARAAGRKYHPPQDIPSAR